ncbi:hypothetical protein NDU88_005475 [Pleurodeles waltl]|uniref:Uncharacterized protein n=1 Tax=Pleurodeles waltl TaxID=8319 RepID=A0AAV7VNM2_PLEWA|nr:hypothetical protein NDU88_005475 [Pleurodeles waltl]
MVMVAARSKNDRSVKEMLTRPSTGKAEANLSTPEKPRRAVMDEYGEGPFTRAFLEGLFTSLREDLQALKRDLLQDLKEVRRELEEVGERVATLEEHESSRH